MIVAVLEMVPPISTGAHVDRTETKLWQISGVLELPVFLIGSYDRPCQMPGVPSHIMTFVLFLFYIIGEMHQTGIGRVGRPKHWICTHIHVRPFGLGDIVQLIIELFSKIILI